MSEITRETRTVETSNDNTEVRDDSQVPESTVVARIVYIITSIIATLLAFRVLLSLLGANRENAFADLIYTLSYPFAAPFFGLFSYEPQYGQSRFELETIFAIFIYLLVGGLIARLLTIKHKEPV